MIEYEYKVMLSKEEYDRVKAVYQWDSVINQVNYYYDTTDFYLRRNDITFRIREIDGTYRLQIKYRDASDFQYASKVEVEYPIEGVKKHFPVLDYQKYLSKIEVNSDLMLLGSLKTNRWIKKLDVTEICLDYNQYLDTEDYELELEFKDDNTEAQKIISTFRISPVKGQGKYRRFFERYIKE